MKPKCHECQKLQKELRRLKKGIGSSIGVVYEYGKRHGREDVLNALRDLLEVEKRQKDRRLEHER